MTFKMPEPKFSSWHGESSKTLCNPTGLCNAFPWPPRTPEDEYWLEKGYHGEALYTEAQLKQAMRDALEAAALKCNNIARLPKGEGFACEKAIRAMKESIK